MACFLCSLNLEIADATCRYIDTTIRKKAIEFAKLNHEKDDLVKFLALDLATEDDVYDVQDTQAQAHHEIVKMQEFLMEYYQTAAFVRKQTESCPGC